MKKITYTITDENGIHARPAGVIVQTAKKFASTITLGIQTKDGAEKRADAKRLFAVMGLGAGRGTVLSVVAEGADEEEAATQLEQTMRKAGL